VTTPSSILVKGRDDALVAQATSHLLEVLVGARDPATCVEELGGGGIDDLDLARLVDALTTPPFLVDRRVVVVRDAGRLSPADADRLAPLLTEPVPGVTAVFVAGGGTVPPGLQKTISAVGEVVDASVGTSVRDRKAFVAEHVKQSSVRLDAAGVERLTAQVGEDLARVDGVLATLAAAYGEGASVTADELEPFLGATGAVPEWDLTDAIALGDAARALDVLHRLIGPGGRAAPAVVFTLQRHYLRLLRLDGAGVRTKEDAASVLSIGPYPAGKLLTSCSSLGSERIRQAVEWIARADADVKGQSALETLTVLEILVARLARQHRAAGRGAR
jgi:DNA polymerase-3 subunit delta